MQDRKTGRAAVDIADNSLIGITMGCPVGIGPEVALKYLRQASDRGPGAVIIGDCEVLASTARLLNLPAVIHSWQPGQPLRPGSINVYQVADVDADAVLNHRELRYGRPSRQTGLAMAAYIKAAARLLREGSLTAMATCPITKAALHEAGYDYPGHTEMLAHLFKTEEFAMMMAGKSLKVTLATIHQSLASVAAALTTEAILNLIDLSARSLRRDFAVRNPRLAVAALNPHAGEGGMFGDEEERIIAPAIARAQAMGWQVEGPFPPDTIFNKAAGGDFDLVVCMYHDQGLIPFKLLHFADGVNVTIGLPHVRTSVDHGTAYDIAGKGLASPASLKAAVEMAAMIAENRRQYEVERSLSSSPVRRGRLIAFEGIDGSGKSTQIELLAETLRGEGFEVLLTREPTDSSYGRRIRELYSHREAVSREEELELFIADRRQHVAEVINPALESGKIVLTDRYFLSTAAYQGANGLEPDDILRRNNFAPSPDLALILEVPPSLSVARIRQGRGETPNDFEQEDYLTKVAAVFAELSGDYIRRLSGTGDLKAVRLRIWQAVKEILPPV
ncbi:4-hydroxythreonine-4-phosphate dehydrogenase PdxA [Desulfobacterota bacterium M19]